MKELFKNKYFKVGFTLFLTFSFCLIFWGLLRSVDLLAIIKVIISILMPFFIGFFIAYLVNPVLNLFENKIFKRFLFKGKPHKKLCRAISTAISMLLTLSVVIVLIVLTVPQLFDSVYSLIHSIPTYLNNISYYFDDLFKNNKNALSDVNSMINNIKMMAANYSDVIPSQLPTLIGHLTNSFFGVLDVIKNLLLGLIISFYILYNKEKFISRSKKVIFSLFNFKKSKEIISTIKEAHVIFGGFITGIIIDSLIIGLLCFLGVSILNMPYPVLIAVIIGVTNVIPFFGPFIGAIPSAFIILMDNPYKVIWFVIFILVLQQFDGNILKPKILGTTTGLETFWVLFAILVGGGLFGFVGMFLGVPLFSIIYALIKKFINRKLEAKKLPIETSEYLSSSNIKED